MYPSWVSNIFSRKFVPLHRLNRSIQLPAGRAKVRPYAAAILVALVWGGCSSDKGKDKEGSNGLPSTTGDVPIDIDSTTASDTSDDSTSNGSTSVGEGGGQSGPYMLPEDFTATDIGGYKLGERLDAGVDLDELIGTDACAYQTIGVVRDFRRGDQEGGHPDFETYGGNGEKGIVEVELGEDLKPIHASGDHEFTTTEEDFDQWYRNDDEVNKAYLIHLSFEPNGDVLTFQSTSFFPLDGAGFGNQEMGHNFGFTTEIHTQFSYHGGETFSFTGDDDLWVFINKKLAIDLGGLHPQQSESISIDQVADQLGLTRGESYSLDLFHAERHSGESNFRIDTTLQFTDCGTVIDDVLIR
jgi:fibro-slime domain-containing protein